MFVPLPASAMLPVLARRPCLSSPVLTTLCGPGGRAKMSDVLPAVEKKNERDAEGGYYEALASDHAMPRWRNAAQWARNSMVKDGLLKADSARASGKSQ